MSYRQDHSAYKAKDGSVGGRNIDDLLDTIDYKNLRRKEEKRLGAERDQRRNLNIGIVESIAKKMQQDWPEDMLVESIQREFPNENPAIVKKLVEHWLEKYKKAEKKAYEILRQVENGEISEEEADKMMKKFGQRKNDFIYQKNDNLFNILVRSCYKSKKAELKEER